MNQMKFSLILKLIPLSLYLYLYILLLIFPSTHSSSFITPNTSNNIPLKSPYSPPIITQLEIESEITYSDDNYFVISTKDGYIQAYSKDPNPIQLWSIYLGKELISTNIINKDIVNEKKTLIPMEGKLFILTNTPDVQFEEFIIPIPDLINRTPFSLGFMPNYYFMGNKNTSQILIDPDKGFIVSHNDMLFNSNNKDKSSQAINEKKLIKLLRIDNTLICLRNEEMMWNTTVSEIIVVAQGSRNEFMLSNDNNDFVNKFIEMVDIKKSDIFSVHKYNHQENIPVKIYDRKNRRPSKDTTLYDYNSGGDDASGYSNEDNYDEIREQKQNSLLINVIQWQNNNDYNNNYNNAMSIIHLFLIKLMYIAKDYMLLLIIVIGVWFIMIRYIYQSYESKTKGDVKSIYVNQANEVRNKNIEDKNCCECEYSDLFNIGKSNKDHQHSKSCSVICNLSLKKNRFAEDYNNHGQGLLNKREEEAKQIQCKAQNDLNAKLLLASGTATTTALITIPYEESKGDCISNLMIKHNSFISNNSHHTENNNVCFDSDSYNSNPLLIEEHQQQHITNQAQETKVNTTTEPTTSPPDDNNNQYQYQTRLEKDFSEFVKIGQGGFGCVLKARHRIDEEIYAIKVIKLKSLNEQTVVKEAKTMTKIHSKNIVEYKTCWFDSSLGSLKDLIQLDDEEESGSFCDPSSILVSMPKSRSQSKIYHTSKKANTSSLFCLSKILEKEKEEDDKDEYSMSKVIFEDKKTTNNNGNNNNYSSNTKSSKDISIDHDQSKKQNRMTKRIFEESFSDEDLQNKLSQRLLLNDFRDDSVIREKSKISKMEMPQYDSYFFIQMEFCNGLSLNQYIEDHAEAGLSSLIIFSFTYQLAKSLKKIHSKNIIHRDIKPANIFIYNENSIKIGDFGLATELNNKSKGCMSPTKGKTANGASTGKEINNSPHNTIDDVCGTPIYLSPEQLEHKKINEKVDIYAMGLVLYEMCGCFETAMERREALNNLKKNRVVCEKVLEKYPIQTKLIMWMTERKPNNRPNAYEILTSDEFREWEENLAQE